MIKGGFLLKSKIKGPSKDHTHTHTDRNNEEIKKLKHLLILKVIQRKRYLTRNKVII